jgi:hypothetical protein
MLTYCTPPGDVDNSRPAGAGNHEHEQVREATHDRAAVLVVLVVGVVHYFDSCFPCGFLAAFFDEVDVQSCYGQVRT